MDVLGPEEKLSFLDVALIRERIARIPFRPCIIFCGPRGLRQILEGTDIAFEDVVAHSNELRPGLWAYTIDKDYEGTKMRKLGLVKIGSAISKH